MRILIVSPYFYPAQYFGGPVQAAFKVGKELVKRGHEVTVFTSDAKDLDNRLESGVRKVGGIEVHYFKNLTMLLAKASRLFVTPKLIQKLDSDLLSYDIIYANEYTTFQNIMVQKFAKKHGIPYVIQTRGSLPIIGRAGRKWLFDSLFGHKILRNASAVVALTLAEYSQCRNLGVPAERIAIIPNGIDLVENEVPKSKGFFQRNFGVPANKKVIFYLGRIHEIKGIDVLVKAFADAKKETDFNALLVISGSDDGYLGKLKALLSSLEIERDVVFTGPLFGKHKFEAYADADVFVLPSYYEAFPNVILEAYSCSTPVIASNVQSISDIVLDQKTGLLFKPADSKSLSKAIQYMLSNQTAAREMGISGRKMVEAQFSIDKIGDSFESLFVKLLKNKNSID
jgi:glycosyltransferase involved in cell wall biosynthesis